MSSMALEPTAEQRFQKAIKHKVNGEYDVAEGLLRTLVEENPANPRVRRELGLVFCFTGLFDESLDELRKVVEIAPSYLDGRNSLGMTYAMLGYMDEAKAEFETVLEMDPNNAEALRQIVYFR